MSTPRLASGAVPSTVEIFTSSKITANSLRTAIPMGKALRKVLMLKQLMEKEEEVDL